MMKIKMEKKEKIQKKKIIIIPIKKMVMEMSMNMPGQSSKGRQELVLKE